MIRLKVALNADSSQTSFFERLASINKEYQGIDLPLSEGTGVLTVETTSDSFEASIRTDSGDELKSFNAYYIEDDDYGDPVYDAYINGTSEENQTQGDVEELYSQWLTELRHELGLFDEDEEWRFLDNGGISATEKYSNQVNYYKRLAKDGMDMRSIPKQHVVAFAKSTLLPAIKNHIMENVLPGLSKSFRFETDITDRTLYLTVSGSILGLPFQLRRNIANDLFQNSYASYAKEPETVVDYLSKVFLSRLHGEIVDTLGEQYKELFSFWDLRNLEVEDAALRFFQEGRIKLWVESFKKDTSARMLELCRKEPGKLFSPAITDVDIFLNLPSPVGTIRQELDYVTNRLVVLDVAVHCYENPNTGKPTSYGSVIIQATA